MIMCENTCIRRSTGGVLHNGLAGCARMRLNDVDERHMSYLKATMGHS